MGKLAIVIVNWNTRELIKQTLDSLLETKGDLNFDVIVSDNGSTDGSVEMIQSEYPEVQQIKNNANIGFAASNNVAFRKVKNEYVLALNPDTIIHAGALEKCIEFMDSHPEHAAVGVKLITESGAIQRSPGIFPGFKTQFLQPLFPFAHRRDAYFEQLHLDVDWVSGAFLFMRKSALDVVGHFDEQFFMYGEETDLCQRIKDRGYKIAYLPEASIIHLGGRSPIEERGSKEARNLQRIVSRLRFVRKHRSALYFHTFRFAMLLQHTLKWIFGKYDFKVLIEFYREHFQLSYAAQKG